ncbi:MAG: OFA family MFS transporter [Armatimonadetes bacterium]|nr:OFA family MFS transporter [Armatimonadota bacterium]
MQPAVQPNPSRGWIVTFCGMGVNLALGVLYTWSVFAAALIDQLNWSKTQSSLPYTVACVVFAIIMVPAGRLVDRYGPKWIAALGGIFCGAGLLICGLTSTLPLAVLGFGIITGIGLGLGYAAPTPAAVKWFPPQKKGQISGLVVAGFGLASVYISPMTNAFLKAWGVQKAFFIEGIIFIVAILILSQALAFPPAGYIPPGPAVSSSTQQAKAKNITGRDYSPGEMLQTVQFWLLWIMFTLTASAGLMIIGHLAKIASIQAHVKWGYIMVAALAIFNAGGRILAGFLSDRLGRTNTMLLVFLLQAANMFLFSNYVSGSTLIAGACLAGLCYGSLLSLFPSATYDFFGLKNAGINYGLVFTAWGAGSLIGPIVAGRVADLTGTYHNAYLISGALLLVAAALVFVTKPPRTIPIERMA